MAQDIVYYKKNVKYPVGVRKSMTDNIGKLLKDYDPYIGVHKENLREFKMANKPAILNGTIVEAPEPSIEWETPNALTPESMQELLQKTFLELKSALQDISSPPILEQLLELAKENNKPRRTLALIEARLAEFDVEEVIDKREEKGVQ